LLTDPSKEVVRNAIRSAGRLGIPEILPSLIRMLAEPRLRGEVREALVNYGAGIVQYCRRLKNSNQPVAVRANILKSCVAGNTRRTRHLIPESATHRSVPQHRVIKASTKCEWLIPNCLSGMRLLNDLILEELRTYYQFARRASRFGNKWLP